MRIRELSRQVSQPLPAPLAPSQPPTPAPPAGTPAQPPQPAPPVDQQAIVPRTSIRDAIVAMTSTPNGAAVFAKGVKYQECCECSR